MENNKETVKCACIEHEKHEDVKCADILHEKSCYECVTHNEDTMHFEEAD